MEKEKLNDRMYQCVLFDLDHTLWDYEKNSHETLRDLYAHYNLLSYGIPDIEKFSAQFTVVNTELWELYDSGKIDSSVIRKERFKKILSHFSLTDEKLCENLSIDYLNSCPTKGHLIPHASEILEYLSGKYSLTVVTNGFEEIQNLKLSSTGLTKYFNHIITSQKAGCKKPSRGIFDFALQMNAAKNHQAMMIGDNLMTDIGGARNALIDTVFFNPGKMEHTVAVTHEIRSLQELRQIL